jgi:hypothetical protein
MPTKLEVKDIAGENCITLSDGQALYEKIHPELKAGKPVELSFNGVRVFASPFFNAAVGQLLRDISSETLNSLLKISNLPASGIETLRKVIDNSRQYYTSENNQKAVSESLKEEE